MFGMLGKTKTNIILICLAIFVQLCMVANAEEQGGNPDKEKRDYWLARGKAAFQCENQYALGMFLYDSSLEKKSVITPAIFDLVENKTIENRKCVIGALSAISKNQAKRAVGYYYKKPRHHDPSKFEDIVRIYYSAEELSQKPPRPSGMPPHTTPF